MDLESILIVLIVFAVVVFQALKHLLSAKTASAPGKAPAWKQKLDDALIQIREEFEAEMAGDSPEPDYRDHIVPEGAAPETVAAAPPERDRSAKRIRRTEEPIAAKTAEPARETGAGIMDLQQAIIWSEILGPPLALRHERGDQ